ncbi:MAG: ethylbenzene dehydrogenase-related protein [Solirubrobacterales bacterium]
MSQNRLFPTLGAAAVALAMAPGMAFAAPDWSKVPETTTTLFYPGQASLEWVMNGPDHGGARSFVKKGDRCYECHNGEQADMGAKMVTGKKAEKMVIPGKRAAIPLKIKAAFDATNLYMRFEFPAGPHNDVPFAQGGKMDPENEVKLAMMIDPGKVDVQTRAGCWSTCHADARDMPSAPDKAKLAAVKGIDTSAGYVTKYVGDSRTALSIAEEPRGGWDKLKPTPEVEAAVKNGAFMDLLRWKAKGNVSEDGFIAAERVMKGGEGVKFEGKKEGDSWVVVMTRKLGSTAPGDVALEAGKSYTVGFAVHDDYTAGRFHHVSVDMHLGLGADGEIKAVKQ